jgi:hypothetical protein
VPAGKQLQHGLRHGCHLGERGADVDALLEKTLDDAVATQRLRLDMLDGVDPRGELALLVVNNPVGHVPRSSPESRR